MFAFGAVLYGLPGALKLLVLLVFPVLGLAIRRKLRLAAAGREEIRRLVVLAAEEAAEAEFEAASEYSNRFSYDSSSSPSSSSSSSSSSSFGFGLKSKTLCAVCHQPTSTRCSRCKSVKYCSGKCQIIHWRRGHKEECRPPALVSDSKNYANSSELRENNNSPVNDSFEERAVSSDCSSSTIHESIEDLALTSSSSDSSSVSTSSMCSTFTISSDTTDDVSSDGSPLRQKQTSVIVDENFSTKIKTSEDFIADTLSLNGKCDVKNPEIFGDQSKAEVPANAFDVSKQTACVYPLPTPLKQVPVCGIIKSQDDSLKSRSSSSREFIVRNSSDLQLRPQEMGSMPVGSSRHPVSLNHRVHTTNSGKSSSISKVVQQFKPSEISKSDTGVKHISRTVFSYDIFIKLYNDKVEIHPFGLMNCGNSCYANVVIQCLAFTRPLNSYLLQGFHSLSCPKSRWCFACELESLVLRAKQGESVLSPASIMSRVHNIGAHLGHGREEDAHEFLRSAVDTILSASHKEKREDEAIQCVPEAALMRFIFGGYIRSKIKCMNCQSKSARNERMMDLTVGITGDVRTLEEALSRFTATEVLDGENRYQCSRCKAYQKAMKKLKVLEAPNILTIALKRFQSGKFGKLNKQVAFPEKLNLAEYMSSSSRKNDKCPIYELYAVVVHLDFMNTAFSGHYVCYVRSTAGKWYKVDDSMIKPVEAKNVLSKTAYMLFYARQSPRNAAAMAAYDDKRPMFRDEENLRAVASYGPGQKRFSDRDEESSDDYCSVFSSSPSGSCSAESATWSSSADPSSVSSSPATFSDDSDDADLTYDRCCRSGGAAAILDSDPCVDLSRFMLHLWMSQSRFCRQEGDRRET